MKILKNIVLVSACALSMTAFGLSSYNLYWQMPGAWTEYLIDVDVLRVAYATVAVTDGTEVSYVTALGSTDLQAIEVSSAQPTIGATTSSIALESVSPYSFFVELMDESFNTVATSERVNASALLAGSMLVDALDPVSAPKNIWQVSFSNSVPEPTSALLLLLGLAGLSVRRKRVVAGFVVAASIAASAAVDDPLVIFSTKGPDLYQDGTTVLDGECYALVWSADGVFEGLAADGTAIDARDAVLVAAPVARGGRCPTVLFEVDKKTAAACAGGRYAVYLLDTRVTAADGRVSVGTGNIVNASGVAQDGLVAAATVARQALTVGSTVAVASKAAAAPTDVVQPQVTGLRIADGYAYISIKSRDGCPLPATLSVSRASALDKGFTAMADREDDVSGATEAVLVQPISTGACFFKVQALGR